MRTPSMVALVFVLSLALVGCATTSPGAADPSTSAGGTPTVSAPPTPLPSELVISVDDITLTEGDGTTTTVAFSDGDAVLALLGEQLGSTPEGTRDPPDAMYPFEQTYYDWGGVYLTVPDGEARSSLAFGVPESNGVELRTIGGIGVGTTRAAAIANGAVESTDYDGDGDGLADYLQVGVEPAPGTDSLTHPGTEGSYFVVLQMDGDVVRSIQSSGNDFSDL